MGRKIIIFTVIICVITGCSALKPDGIIEPLSPSSPAAADCPKTSQREKFAWTAGSITTAVVLVIIICGYGVYKFCNRAKERTWCVRIKLDETELSLEELAVAVRNRDRGMRMGLPFMETKFVLQEKRKDKEELIFRKEFNLSAIEQVRVTGVEKYLLVGFMIDRVLYAGLKISYVDSPKVVNSKVFDLCEIKRINPLSIDDLEVKLIKSDDDFPITKLITIIGVEEKKQQDIDITRI